MIVNRNKNGLSIIYHAAHGLLAGKIANQIDCKYRPEPWFESLVAVTEHDDRQLNFEEKSYLSEVGIPLDFTEEQPTIHEILKRMKQVIISTKNKSSWTRLLVSYHIEFLYGKLQSESKKISSFFKTESIARKAIHELYDCSDKKARESYEFLRFCDRLSLILCHNKVPEQGRKLEINRSISNKRFFIYKLENDTLSVKPWLFEADSFKLSVEKRSMDYSYFSSEQEFETTLNNCSPTLLKWQFNKG